MKPGGSGLNPYAKPYVPVARREVEESRIVVSEPHHAHQQQAHGFAVQGTGNYAGSQMSTRDEDMDMDIDYLLVMFSGLSYESINDVYLANNGDLDATIDMLTHLDMISSESQEEFLPDTLDIGDVPETIEPSTSTASNQEKTNTEASALPSSLGIPKANVPSS